MDARYVIHAVGPVWQGGNKNEENLLANCYKNALQLAKAHNCESIAFPMLASGNYGFPKALALQIAIREIGGFLMKNEMDIYLVVFSKDAFELSEKLFSSVASYIDETYVHDKLADEYEITYDADFCEYDYLRTRRERECPQFVREMEARVPGPVCFSSAERVMPEQDLESVLEEVDAGFSETLLSLIDISGKKDSDIYKKADIDRKLFSKIRNNTDYRPSKATALAFAIALELDLEETKDFIARAGYALSHSSKFDIIVEYFIVRENYDVFELNEVLFAFDQPLIGA